jgi:hypothetical protein
MVASRSWCLFGEGEVVKERSWEGVTVFWGSKVANLYWLPRGLGPVM